MQQFIQQTAKALAAHAPVSAESLASWLEQPPDKTMGDLALPCFRLAKDMRKAPNAIAAELSFALENAEWIERTDVVGAYLNIYLQRESAFVAVLSNIKENKGFFTSDRGTGVTVAIDLSSPNIAKPFSMGHLRSTVIGTALANLLVSDGYRVLRINHLGDWGTQFGKMMVAYHLYGDAERVRMDPIAELTALYVRFHEEAKEQPALEDQARAAFKALEDGEEESLALWRWIVDVSMAEFAKTYEVLGTAFTHQLGESFYNDKMDAVVTDLRAKGLLVNSEGAEVVMLEEQHLPPCLIRRSDGATLYPTRDLAAALYRHNTLGADRLLYVVGGEQRLHFQQVFQVLALMGYPFAKDCSHVAFGMMRMDGKKMSTRKGQVVRLQDVLDEAIARAKAIIAEKNPQLADADQVARAIGVGAVVFNDLKTHRLHDVNFILENALSFDGETGPYVQYTHARACSVLRKAHLLEAGDSPATLVLDPARTVAKAGNDPEWELVKQLSLFPEMRLRAIAESDPSLVAKHVLDVCQAFNHFYHDCPILTAESEVRAMRLLLTDAARVVIRHALRLLGIAHPTEI